MWKKILKWALILLLALVIIGFISIRLLSEKMPEINPTSEADQLAEEIWMALDKPGWDTLRYLQWTFPGGHHYFWDKENNLSEVKWGSKRVLLDLDEVDGQAYDDGKEQEGKEKEEYIHTAWSYWCNDSFWMFAPFKIKDPGTQRTLVENVEKGSKGLLVSYNSGGVTPGDAYLWLVDDNNIPIGYKMWVSIIPIKGIYASWGDWITTPQGAKLATTHKMSFITMKMENVKSGQEIADFGFSENPLLPLIQG